MLFRSTGAAKVSCDKESKLMSASHEKENMMMVMMMDTRLQAGFYDSYTTLVGFLVSIHY
jgi:hypothetical protein